MGLKSAAGRKRPARPAVITIDVSAFTGIEDDSVRFAALRGQSLWPKGRGREALAEKFPEYSDELISICFTLGNSYLPTEDEKGIKPELVLARLAEEDIEMFLYIWQEYKKRVETTVEAAQESAKND